MATPAEGNSALRIVGGVLIALGVIVIVLDRLPPGMHPDPRPEGWICLAGFCLVVFGALFIMANRRPGRPGSGSIGESE